MGNQRQTRTPSEWSYLSFRTNKRREKQTETKHQNIHLSTQFERNLLKCAGMCNAVSTKRSMFSVAWLPVANASKSVCSISYRTFSSFSLDFCFCSFNFRKKKVLWFFTSKHNQLSAKKIAYFFSPQRNWLELKTSYSHRLRLSAKCAAANWNEK